MPEKKIANKGSTFLKEIKERQRRKKLKNMAKHEEKLSTW
jgi:hypothetical protein